jgi:hypothetical protein
MLRRAYLTGLLLAAATLPALAADFVVKGNVNVAGQEGAPGTLTVTGDTTMDGALTIGQAGQSGTKAPLAVNGPASISDSLYVGDGATILGPTHFAPPLPRARRTRGKGAEPTLMDIEGTVRLETGDLNVSTGSIHVPTVPEGGDPACNGGNTFGEIGTGIWQNTSNPNETDLMLYFCGWKRIVQNGNVTVLAQRYLLSADWWPESSTGQAAPRQSGAGADTAALATRVATLEKQLAALKAITCRDHASEAACQ